MTPLTYTPVQELTKAQAQPNAATSTACVTARRVRIGTAAAAAAWLTALHAQLAGFITVTAPVRRRPLIQPAKRFWVLWFMSTIMVSADKSWRRGGLMRVATEAVPVSVWLGVVMVRIFQVCRI